ncbi:hypothetical protein ACRXCV_03250 [Halobacteriovorax sp. GFR7]|uniref:hypothetical protein n=1 Tax=unclassified Halobacteriovorax TaxID=2639665 RepID=UPI003D9891BF
MKKLITVCAILISTLSLANDFTLEEKAQLATLKMTSEVQLKLYTDAIKDISNIKAEYEDTVFLALGKKRALKKLNCATIKTIAGVNLIMLMTNFEQSKSALEKIDMNESDVEDFTSNFKDFLINVKDASENCKNIKKSSKSFTKSYEQLKEAMDILSSYLPELF